MDKTIVELVVVGKDHEGVVAGFTNFIFQNNGNIEKINQNVVKGLFGMYLEASFAKKLDVNKFNKEAEKLAKNLKMEVNIHYEVSKRKKVAILVTKESHCLEAILMQEKELRLKERL